MKKLYIDFETTNIDPAKAYILTIGALFVDDNKVVGEFHRKIKFLKRWDKLDRTELEALMFNKIRNAQEQQQFNDNAEFEIEVILDFLKKVKEFTKGEKIRISGWNNAWFEAHIINNALIRNNIDFLEYFDYHPRDVMAMFAFFHERFFEDKFRMGLKYVHKNLIGTMKDEDFHNALNDCKATFDVDMWLEKQRELIKDSFQFDLKDK